MMTAESIKLLVRHGLTALGPLLIALQISDETQTGHLIDAIADGTGAVATLTGLVWSFARKLKRSRQAPAAAQPKA